MASTVVLCTGPEPEVVREGAIPADSILAAARDAMLKLNPVGLSKNPVIFVTEVVAALVSVLWLRDLVGGLPDRVFSGQIAAWQGTTDIFIYPGYRFRVADALMTNFHLPKSTLLMLVSAFAGRELIRKQNIFPATLQTLPVARNLGATDGD